MRQAGYLTQSLVLAILLFLILSGDAHAYLDPGIGSFLLKILIATLAGVAYVFRRYWTNFRLLVSSLISRKHKRE